MTQLQTIERYECLPADAKKQYVEILKNGHENEWESAIKVVIVGTFIAGIGFLLKDNYEWSNTMFAISAIHGMCKNIFTAIPFAIQNAIHVVNTKGIDAVDDERIKIIEMQKAMKNK